MFLEHCIEVLDFGPQASTRQTKENDAGVQEALVEYQLAEVPVGNEQNTFLVPGYREDILIGKSMTKPAKVIRL